MTLCLLSPVEIKVASSATESRIKQVLSFIRSRNGEGISKREVDRHELFRSMKSYEVKEIIETVKKCWRDPGN
jgi:hypothetical protein